MKIKKKDIELFVDSNATPQLMIRCKCMHQTYPNYNYCPNCGRKFNKKYSDEDLNKIITEFYEDAYSYTDDEEDYPFPPY